MDLLVDPVFIFTATKCIHMLDPRHFIMWQNSSYYIYPSPFSSTSAIIRSTSAGSTDESKHKISLISSGDKSPLLSASNNSNACLSLWSVIKFYSSIVAITNSVQSMVPFPSRSILANISSTCSSDIGMPKCFSQPSNISSLDKFPSPSMSISLNILSKSLFSSSLVR